MQERGRSQTQKSQQRKCPGNKEEGEKLKEFERKWLEHNKKREEKIFAANAEILGVGVVTP